MATGAFLLGLIDRRHAGARGSLVLTVWSDSLARDVKASGVGTKSVSPTRQSRSRAKDKKRAISPQRPDARAQAHSISATVLRQEYEKDRERTSSDFLDFAAAHEALYRLAYEA